MIEDELPDNPGSVGYDAGAAFGSIMLNPRYTFENFMVGRSNRMAYAGAVAVAEKPALAYNPYFIYGDVGLGKTHLAHAIGQDAVERGYTVLYTTAEAFGNDMMKAMRAQAIEEFHQKYRQLDMLLVDDVQYVERKTLIFQELFFTIDALHQRNKQTVLCSDRRPEKLDGLTDQMRSRLTGGSIVDVTLPDMELRTAILRSKPEVYEYNVPLECVDHIARVVKSNVRELEGALQNVIARARLMHVPYSLEMTKEALEPLLARIEKPPKLSVEGIVELVSGFYSISPADIYSQQRDRAIVFPRQVVMYLLRKELVMPLETIGQRMGRDHSTVIYIYRKIEKRLETDAEARNEIHLLRQRLYDD